MNSPNSAPQFDAHNYARPNQKWTCGHACEGRACRSGPDAWGRCQATSECRPVLETKPGETKGRWRCTRTEGACDEGPLPDGTCCRPIPKCAPVPTLRVWRGRITVGVVCLSSALLLLLTGHPVWRNRFINPGPVSRVHSSTAFTSRALTNGAAGNCAACHIAGDRGPDGILQAALQARPGMLELGELIRQPAGHPTGMDTACLRCHGGRNFHQPTAPLVSCSVCHAEHQGRVMAAAQDQSCGFCHANSATMTVARRPAVIHHFATDHPEFRFQVDKLADPDTLRFNHALHLTGATIPRLPGGSKLDCAYCHQPDATGAYMRPVKFADHCRLCHSLQFDPDTPQLQLPHGSTGFVSAFLRSLSKQYADLAAREHPADATAFVQQKLAGLRATVGSGEELERRVFFSSSVAGPEARIGSLSGATRAIFPGCAYCHEVKAAAPGNAIITPPVQTERWLGRARFNHAKHTGVECAQCHDARHSQATADILLPGRAACVGCHSPAGGVRDACSECHTYHQPPQIAAR